MLHTL